MFKKPRGTNDVYGRKSLVNQWINEVFSNVMKTYNYEFIETPIFEQKDLFVRGVGDDSDIVSKEMYEFKDRKNREFVLRPEGTSGVVRAIVENKLYVQNNLPVKVYYSGPMFRYERPQAGRSRQFNQLGIESFGIDSSVQDFEILDIAMQVLTNLKLAKNSKIYLNYLVSGDNRKKYIEDLKTYLRTIPDLDKDCQKRIDTNPLRVLDCKVDGSKFINVPNMQNYLDKKDSKSFEDLIKLLNELDYDVVIDNKLVRGLDYYTGFVFEIKYETSSELKNLTLIGGGRYNNLVNEFGGPTIPASGFGAGTDRIADLIIQENLDVDISKRIDIYVGILGTLSAQKIEFVKSLRLLGLVVETNLQEASIKQIFKDVEKYHANKVIILGDNELKTGKFKIKDQLSGMEKELSFNNIKIEDLI